MGQRRRYLVEIYKLGDLLVMVGSFLAVVYLAAGQATGHGLMSFLEQPLEVSNLLLLLGLIAVWRVVLKAFGLYESRRLSRRRNESYDILKATTLGSLLMLGLVVTFDVEPISDWRWSTVAFWGIVTSLTITLHLTLRLVLGKARRIGRNLRDIVIVGTNERARAFADSIAIRPHLGYRIVGFVDDDWPGLAELRAEGRKRVANLENLGEFLRCNVVDEVFLALPIKHYPQGERVISLCEEQGITVRFMPALVDLATAQTRVEMFGGQPVVTMQPPGMEGWPGVLKRGLDFAGALVLLVALAPLFLVVATLIKVLSPGPVFFVQKRLGFNKRLFPLIKFRTMVVDAEARLKELEALNESGGATFKIKNDPRLTPIGAFLRRTSIDELPQLLNVLMGHMSLVGPRPLPERDYAGFSEDWQRRRFSVKPGLTCLWQISGRSNITFDRWMELDMEYIDRWTLGLDLTILARTVPVVLRGTGAV